MKLSKALWEESLDLARACLEHPFVRGIADGSLTRDTFRGYVAQDAAYLNAFLRAYAVLCARCERADHASAFVELQQGVLEELKLHAAYAERWGVDLRRVVPFRTTRAYSDFLLRCAWHGGLGEGLAAMTPCMRLYHHLGVELARGGIPDHDYAEWIRTYSAGAFGDLVERIEKLLDTHAEDSPEVRDAYRYAMRCELDFFAAAWEGGS
jgi:thiaminase/transcriptional activator TenA